MAKFQVTAPEAAYDGSVGGVQFTDGKALIDEDTHPAELAYCRSAGYRVEAAEEPKAEEPKAEQETKPAPRRAATKKESEK